MLNSRELLERGIVTGDIFDENIAQVGIDLNVIKIERITSGGVIPAKGKTTLATYEPTTLGSNHSWFLLPGTYNVEMLQGCNIPKDVVLLIRQRSSLLRNGAILHSSVFDPGFETKSIGTVLVVNNPIHIEYGARICQIYGHSCTPVNSEDLYNGQWKNDNQRNKK